MDYDQVLEHVGQFGLWQWLITFLACLAAMAEAFMTLQVKLISKCFTIEFFRQNINSSFPVLFYWLLKLRRFQMPSEHL